MKTGLLSSLFLFSTLVTPLQASSLPTVDVRFAKTAFAAGAPDEAKYEITFRDRLVPELSRELSKELPGYHLIVTFDRIPSSKRAIHYVSEKGERIAYEEPKVLRFTYQLLDANHRVVGAGSTELAESVSFVEPATPRRPQQPNRDFTPEAQLVLNWAKGLRQYRT